MGKRPVIGEDVLDAHYHAVGQIAASWSLLEFRIDTVIWKLAGVEQMPGACLSSQFSGLGSRMKALLALLDLRFGDKDKAFWKRLHDFVGTSHGLQEQRNRIVHDALMINTDTNEAISIRTAVVRNKLDYGPKPIPLEEIDSFRKKIGVHTNAFHGIANDIYSMLKAAPKKWARPLAEMRPRLGPLGIDSNVDFLPDAGSAEK